MKFDELNRLFKGYFDVMDISEEDKRKRVDCAFFFYDAVWYVLTMIRLELKNNSLVDKGSYVKSLYYRVKEKLDENDFEYDEDYLTMFSEQIVDTTFDYIEEDDEDFEDDYFLSEQRAISVAENEANNVLNKADYKKAKREGKLYKTWISELDSKTRPWHWDAYGQKKGIDE